MKNLYIMLIIFVMSGFGYAHGLYHPHILRTMRGELGLAEYGFEGLGAGSFHDDTTKIPGYKSIKTAYIWSSVSTLLPLGVAILFWEDDDEGLFPIMASATGLLIGPSVGHFYVGNWGFGIISIVLRTAIVSVCALSEISYMLNPWSGDEDNELLNCGTFIFAASIAIDFLMIPVLVHEHNKQIRLEFFHKLEQEHQKVGLGISFSF